MFCRLVTEIFHSVAKIELSTKGPPITSLTQPAERSWRRNRSPRHRFAEYIEISGRFRRCRFAQRRTCAHGPAPGRGRSWHLVPPHRYPDRQRDDSRAVGCRRTHGTLHQAGQPFRCVGFDRRTRDGRAGRLRRAQCPDRDRRARGSDPRWLFGALRSRDHGAWHPPSCSAGPGFPDPAAGQR